MLTYRNIIRNGELMKVIFMKSIFRKIGFAGGFLYGINQNNRINNIEISGFNSGLIYGSIGMTVMGSMPLWVIMNIYFFGNYNTFIFPDVKISRHKPKPTDNKYDYLSLFFLLV
jgi:hypothetical protein